MMLGAVDTIMLSRHSDNSVAAVGVVNQIIISNVSIKIGAARFARRLFMLSC
jgi:Na+-driven multidrug efflux pump